MLLRIFTIVFPVFAIVGIGYLYGRFRRIDLTAANQINMAVLLPALIFSVIPAKTFVPPMMFTNSGNMGLPLAVFAFGEAALPAAVVVFIVENGLHFTLGTWLMDRRAHWLEVLRQPIVIATLAGIAFSLSGLTLPAPLPATIELLGQASIPLLLVSLGTRLTAIDLREWRLGLLGAIACPVTGVLMVLILTPFLKLVPGEQSLLILFSVLPPAVLNFLVAERYRQEPARVAAIVMIGNLGAVVSVPLALAYALR